MTVREVIEMLEKENPDLECMIAYETCACASIYSVTSSLDTVYICDSSS